MLQHHILKTEETTKGMEDGAGTYTGETSRSIFERVGEHYGDLESLRKDSHMVKHWFTSHATLEEAPPFRFKLVGKFKDCLTRQLKEAVILGGKPLSLNSKGEFGNCTIPRLTIEPDLYKQKLKEIEERKNEEEEEKKWKELVEKVRGKKEEMFSQLPTTTLKRKSKPSAKPPQHNINTMPGPVNTGLVEINTAKQNVCGTDNRQNHRLPHFPLGVDMIDTAQKEENVTTTDMEKAENVCAPDEGGTVGKGGVDRDYRRNAVSKTGDHALANISQNTHNNLEEGREKGTPKRKLRDGGDLREYESPAKKRNLREEFDFENLKNFWTSKQSIMKPSVRIFEKTNDEGNRKARQQCHNQGQPTEIGENESGD